MWCQAGKQSSNTHRTTYKAAQSEPKWADELVQAFRIIHTYIVADFMSERLVVRRTRDRKE